MDTSYLNRHFLGVENFEGQVPPPFPMALPPLTMTKYWHEVVFPKPHPSLIFYLEQTSIILNLIAVISNMHAH